MTTPTPFTARDKFTIGQRVALSAEGRARFRGDAGGIVVGFSRQPHTSVRVRRDGNTTPAAYHMDYWTRAPE